MKSYEGMPAYEAGIEEGKEQIIKSFETWRVPALNMLSLILESTEEDYTYELANDCYNCLVDIEYESLPLVFKVNEVSEDFMIKLP